MSTEENVSNSLMRQPARYKIALVDIPDGQLSEHSITWQGQLVSLLVMRDGKQLSVWRNQCPHAGRRLDWAPGKFLFEEGKLVCPAHGAMIDLADGRCVSGLGRGSSLLVVPAQLDDAEVIVFLDKAIDG